jgi:hypothetical protein
MSRPSFGTHVASYPQSEQHLANMPTIPTANLSSRPTLSPFVIWIPTINALSKIPSYISAVSLVLEDISTQPVNSQKDLSHLRYRKCSDLGTCRKV